MPPAGATLARPGAEEIAHATTSGLHAAAGRNASLCSGLHAHGFPDAGRPYGIATVTGSPRTYLLASEAPCPSDNADCRTPAYLVPGNRVITGAATGYVRKDQLSPPRLARPAPLPSDWASTWHKGDDRITLRADGDSLVANDEAYYPSAHPSPKDRPGGPNLGDMSGAAIPSGNRVTFAGKNADACRVTLTLVPPSWWPPKTATAAATM